MQDRGTMHTVFRGGDRGLIVMVLGLAVVFAGCGHDHGHEHEAAVPATSPVVAGPLDQYGVEVKGLNLSAAGYMLDFRFMVVDPDKAAAIFGPEVENTVIDQQSGAKLIVPAPPKVGSMRQNKETPRKDKTYFVMFANPGRFIKRGDKVTVVLGPMELKDVVVQ